MTEALSLRLGRQRTQKAGGCLLAATAFQCVPQQPQCDLPVVSLPFFRRVTPYSCGSEYSLGPFVLFSVP